MPDPPAMETVATEEEEVLPPVDEDGLTTLTRFIARRVFTTQSPEWPETWRKRGG